MTAVSSTQPYGRQPENYTSALPDSLGKDDFLQLLVTQLRYQDPMDPMKDKEFVAQLAQFSQLEQLQNMSGSLDTNTQVDYIMSQTIANTMAASLIGKTVIAQGTDFTLTPGQNIDLAYNLATDAAHVSVKIYNDSGALVRTVTLEGVSQGDNVYTWDGRDNNDSPLAPGNYSYEISAETLTGETITSSKRVIGEVNSVKYVDGKAYLIVGGGFKVDLSTIIEIQQNDNAAANHTS